MVIRMRKTMGTLPRPSRVWDRFVAALIEVDESRSEIRAAVSGVYRSLWARSQVKRLLNVTGWEYDPGPHWWRESQES